MYLLCFFPGEVGNGVPEAGVLYTVPGMGDHRFKPPNQFMFALGAGIKMCQPKRQRQLDALIVTGLEMQVIVFVQTALVPAVKRVLPRQKQGPGDHLALFDRHDHVHMLG